MPWVRQGDTAATDPSVLALESVKGADDRLANEAWGFLMRVASLSAGHLRDGEVDLATARLVAAHRAPTLLRALVDAGLMRKTGRGRGERWWIVDDKPDLIHIRSKSEVEWDRQRRRDNSNTDLTMQIRLRDGDACRYCGKTVNFWGDRRGARGGTYDHREPGKPGAVATMVVACKSCNSSRNENVAEWDSAHPLLPVPSPRHFHPKTVEALEARGCTRADMGLDDVPDPARAGHVDREHAPKSAASRRELSDPGSGGPSWQGSVPAGSRGDEPCEDPARPERTGEGERGKARTRLATGRTNPAPVPPAQVIAPTPASHRVELSDLGASETFRGHERVTPRSNWSANETEPPDWAAPSPAERALPARRAGPVTTRSRGEPEVNEDTKRHSELGRNGQRAGQGIPRSADSVRSELSDPGRVGQGRAPTPEGEVRRSRRGRRKRKG